MRVLVLVNLIAFDLVLYMKRIFRTNAKQIRIRNMKSKNTYLSIAALSLGLVGQSIAATTAPTIHDQRTLAASSSHHAGSVVKKNSAASGLGPAVSLMGGFSFKPPAGFEYGLRTMSYPNTIAQVYGWAGPKRADGTQELLLVIVAVPLRGYQLIIKGSESSSFIQTMLSGFQNDPAFFHSEMDEDTINDLPFLREYGKISAASNTISDGSPSAGPMSYNSPAHVYNIDVQANTLTHGAPLGQLRLVQATPAAPTASNALVHFFIYACTTPKGIISFIGTDSEPYNKTTLDKLEASVMTVKNPAY